MSKVSSEPFTGDLQAIGERDERSGGHRCVFISVEVDRTPLGIFNPTCEYSTMEIIVTNSHQRKLVRVKAVHVPELQSRPYTDFYVFDLIVDANCRPCGETETLGYECFLVGREYTDRTPIRILPDLQFLSYEIAVDGRGKKHEIEHKDRISKDIVAKVGRRFFMCVDDEYEYEIVETFDVVELQ
ncbi:MAG: hypothetical protein GY796_21700 [Chloroflexi bacterium]|nr:hypothetical protein [Chloroflexota bacterium]